MQLEGNTRDLIVEVIDRLLTTDKPASASVIRAPVWNKNNVLAELANDLILLDVGSGAGGEKLYQPRLLAFELCADKKRFSYALDCAGSWLKYVRDLALKTNRLDVMVPNPWDLPANLRKPMFFMLLDFSKYVESIVARTVNLRPEIHGFENVAADWTEELLKRGITPIPKVEKKTVLSSPDPTHPTDRSLRDQDFSFVNDDAIRRILIRDYGELLSTPRHCLKSRFILLGGIIEGILLDSLMQDAAKARSAVDARRDARDIEQWGLSVLLDVAVELKLISPSAQSFGHAVREYRNLVHPGLERRSNLSIAQEEVEIAERVLRIVIRDRNP